MQNAKLFGSRVEALQLVEVREYGNRGHTAASTACQGLICILRILVHTDETGYLIGTLPKTKAGRVLQEHMYLKVVLLI